VSLERPDDGIDAVAGIPVNPSNAVLDEPLQQEIGRRHAHEQCVAAVRPVETLSRA
jgi:hypothetical protein